MQRANAPSLVSPPEGCHFRPRCPHAFNQCTEIPELVSRVPEAHQHLDRCWLEPDRKREFRKVGDQIGLRSEETVIS